MSERLSGAESPRGKFARPRDEVLYILCNEGWANQSSGDAQAPTGWFARISNDAADVDDIARDFSDEVGQAGLSNPDELTGHFLVKEGELGFIDVQTYDTEDDLKRVYDELDGTYGEWARGDA